MTDITQNESKSDILDQLKNELVALKARVVELEALNSEKDRFFSLIAHDLKSPFHALLGYSELLSEQFDSLPKDKILTYIFRLKNTSTKAYHLIDNLLVWSRLQTNKSEVTKENFELFNLIDQIEEEYTALLSEKEISFLNIIPQEVNVKANIDMMLFIISNLISNSIRHTKSTGKIIIWLKQIEGFWEIHIEDTGIGIPATILPSIFELNKSYRVDSKFEEKGTGLGLVICKEMIERNGGSINIISEEGIGTQVVFTVPR